MKTKRNPRGAGRKCMFDKPMKAYTVKLPVGQIEAICKQTGMNMGELVRSLLASWRPL